MTFWNLDLRLYGFTFNWWCRISDLIECMVDSYQPRMDMRSDWMYGWLLPVQNGYQIWLNVWLTLTCPERINKKRIMQIRLSFYSFLENITVVYAFLALSNRHYLSYDDYMILLVSVYILKSKEVVFIPTLYILEDFGIFTCRFQTNSKILMYEEDF